MLILLNQQGEVLFIAKRPGAKALISISGCLPMSKSAVTLAASGARRIPLRKSPLARKTFLSEVGPINGKSSGVPGLNPAQVSVTLAAASSGTYLVAA